MGAQGLGNVASPSFGGTQGYLNNAIGAENYLLTGGASQLSGPWGQQNLQPVGVGSTPSPFGSGQPSTGGSGGGNVPVAGGGAGMNPYLAQYYNAAAQPLTQNFQNTVAPNLLANFANSGTVGGSGQQQAFNTAESNLSRGLADLGANLYEPAYQQAQQIASNQAMQTQALNAQAGMQSQQLSANELMQQRGLAADLFRNAISNAPALAQAAYIPANQMAASGAAGQNQLQNILNNAYGNLNTQGMWPYQVLSNLGAGVQGIGGMGQGSSSSTMSGQGGWK